MYFQNNKKISGAATTQRMKLSSLISFSDLIILLNTKIKSKTLQKKLLRKNILIRDCSTFRGLNENYVRIAVKKRKDNLKLIKALEAI